MLRYLQLAVRRCAATLRAIEPSLAASSAGPAGDHAGLDSVRPVVEQEIARGKDRIAQRVAGMQALTEREILACGSALSAIFEQAGRLIADAESAAAASLARHEHSTAQFGQGMRDDCRAQELAVAQVLQLAGGIADSIGAIDTLTRVSKMLAINTRIEAARSGLQGQPFAVISDRMRELSDAVQAAASQVKSALEAMRESIPPVVGRAASINARTESFIAEVAAQQRDAERGNGRLDTIVKLSNRALSHLQFQDRLQQQLTSIDGAVGSLEQRACRALSGELDLDEPDDAPMPGDGEPGSGAVLLFQAGGQ